MYLLGLDIGSSSVKACIVDAASGKSKGTEFYPEREMPIIASQQSYAEQAPDMWWENAKEAIRRVIQKSGVDAGEIKSIGISYQMHGLVCVDKNKNVLRNSIIWCDSRAAEIGRKAFDSIGKDKCLANLLNSPGNFTASKLRWVKENEPELFDKIYKIMLPGDYIAMKITGNINTTVTGLSEGIFWNFKTDTIADFLLDYYGIPSDFIPETVPVFSNQGQILPEVAKELGISPVATVNYRAGDQPNNAFSLNVLQPGEIAAVAGTSGVVYGVSSEVKADDFSRVNTFAHVNHTAQEKRLGILLCINGTGILNSWLQKNVNVNQLSYKAMNDAAATVPVGADGLVILPFGNGSERILNNQNSGAQINNLNFNIHRDAHFYRAAQEGIVFSFKYGIDIMSNLGIVPKTIKAGEANMFLSPLFRSALATLTGSVIELYNTDGSQGAARGAGIGCKAYASEKEAFAGLEKTLIVVPDASKTSEYKAAYENWLKGLNAYKK